MTENGFAEEFRELLQPVYATLLDRRGIPSGDIDPLLSYQLEQAEDRLARLVGVWLSVSQLDTEKEEE